MPRYIEESEAIECIKFGKQFGFNPIQSIQHTPTADVTKVVHGEWIITETGMLFSKLNTCSLCNYRISVGSPLNYCPNCGARMKGEDK